MKTVIALALMAVSFGAAAAQHVKGYTRSDGTYVAPHIRSSPNNTQSDNYSTKGNINPYTGKQGAERDTTYDLPKPYNPFNQDGD